MANLEKHLKSPTRELAEADASPIPTHTRSPHIIGYYIKNRRHHGQPRAASDKQRTPIRLNLESVDREALKKMCDRVPEINRSLRRRKVPFRLKLL